MDSTYFIANSKYVKIGKSFHVDRRFKDLLVGSPEPLSLLLVLPGNRERELHQQFKSYHVRGEWFELTKEIRDFIARELTKEDILAEFNEIEKAIATRLGPCSLEQRKQWMLKK